MNRRFAVAAFGLMASATYASHLMRPTKHMTDILPKLDLEEVFPKEFGPWRVDASVPLVLPSPDVQAALDIVYNQVLSRTYINDDGQRIMLSVAYGGDQSDGTKIHRPENCYPGQGFTIASNRTEVIALPGYQLPVRRLVAVLPPRVEPISYWMMVDEVPSLTSTQNKLAQLRIGLKGYVPDGMLIRISSISRDIEEEYQVQDKFIADLFRVMSEPVRRRVFGK